MAFETGFISAAIFLAAALAAILLGKWSGLGAVLGYLAIGAAIGPWGLELIGGNEGEDVTHFAEFGVVLMLFLIGLELRPKMLWQMRKPLLGLGGLQVLISIIAIAGVAMLFGLPWAQALVVGMVLALSSTAIVLQSLNERGLRRTGAGRDAFSVLLFQDVAVIPLIALIPIVAAFGSGAETDIVESVTKAAEQSGNISWMSEFHPGLRGLITIGAVAGVIFFSWLVMRPLFRAVAGSKQREAFTAAALLLVIAVALVMSRVGLSAALGAFVAGVVLASSEYRHELEADLEPFKGLLLGLFFIGVGMGIDFGHIRENLAAVLTVTCTLMVVKGIILYGLARANGGENYSALLVAASLAAGGEFAFVLVKVAEKSNAMSDEIAPTLIAAVALSMAATPLLILGFGKLYQRSEAKKNSSGKADRDPDVVDVEAPVIVCGFGRFGHAVGRLVRGQGFDCSVLDHDSDQVELLRGLGIPIHYGDAARPDLLAAAGAEHAKVLVICIKDRQETLNIAATARELYPHLEIFLRAHGRPDAYDLLEAGEQKIYRDTLDSSLRMGADVLEHLGMKKEVARTATETYRKGDEQLLRDMLEHRHDHKRYVSKGREAVKALDDLMRRERQYASDEE